MADGVTEVNADPAACFKCPDSISCVGVVIEQGCLFVFTGPNEIEQI